MQRLCPTHELAQQGLWLQGILQTQICEPAVSVILQTQICEPPVSVIAFHYLNTMACAGGHEGRLEG